MEKEQSMEMDKYEAWDKWCSDNEAYLPWTNDLNISVEAEDMLEDWLEAIPDNVDYDEYFHEHMEYEYGQDDGGTFIIRLFI